MPVYVSLIKFTQQGISTMKQQGIARSAAVQRNIDSMGGRLLDAYYCLGDYDVVAILEFPNNRTAMKAAVLNSSLGHIKITTMPAVTRGEWREMLHEMWPAKSVKNKRK
ncbi:MAG: GYD domain-containing protein [Nitrospirae bacterium]|nr:GYD domain-containing protein [Nitrospirota bacterium]